MFLETPPATYFNKTLIENIFLAFLKADRRLKRFRSEGHLTNHRKDHAA